MKKVIIGVFYLAILCGLWGISYLSVAVVIGVLSFCFGFTFTWKLALGAWIIWVALNALLKERK